MTIFEKIIKREVSAHVVYETDEVLAILDIFPKSLGHTLIIPKISSSKITDIEHDSYALILLKEAYFLAKTYMHIDDVSGVRIQINNGRSAGQEIEYTHIHVIPTRDDSDINNISVFDLEKSNEFIKKVHELFYKND